MFLMNKNVIHNGISYPKGAEIKKDDAGFEALVGAGHANEIKAIAEIKSEVSPEQEAASESKDEQEKESAQQGKPAKPGRK